MNFPRISQNEETGVVTYAMDADVAVELGYILMAEGRRTQDRGWDDDGSELFKLGAEWKDRRAHHHR